MIKIELLEQKFRRLDTLPHEEKQVLVDHWHVGIILQQLRDRGLVASRDKVDRYEVLACYSYLRGMGISPDLSKSSIEANTQFFLNDGIQTVCPLQPTESP